MVQNYRQMKMLNKITSFGDNLSSLKSIPLLIIRIVLAYGFYKPAVLKWKSINGIAEWFASMNFPFPTINAYMAATTETLGVVLLLLGFATRLISIPLIFTMLIAIFAVHLSNGFEASNNGFEIPLYYLVMLFVLLVSGSGKYSIDAILNKNK